MLRSQQASEVLVEIVQNGALPGSSRKYLRDGGDDGIAELLSLGFVRFDQEHGDSIKATHDALRAMHLTQVFDSPVPIYEYHPAQHLADTDMSSFELLLKLLASGWQERRVSTKSKRVPYHRGDEKIVLLHDRSPLSGLYLRALLRSEELFAKNICEIHHFQSEAYYRALLDCDASQAGQIKPGLGLQEYKSVIRGHGEDMGALQRDSDSEGNVSFVLLFQRACHKSNTNSIVQSICAVISHSHILTQIVGALFTTVLFRFKSCFAGQMNMLKDKDTNDTTASRRGRGRGKGKGRGRRRVQVKDGVPDQPSGEKRSKQNLLATTRMCDVMLQQAHQEL